VIGAKMNIWMIFVNENHFNLEEWQSEVSKQVSEG
jgi:hypothetical protein